MEMDWFAKENRTMAPPAVSNITIIVGDAGVGKTHLLSRMPPSEDGTPRGLYVPVGNEQGLGGFAKNFTAERIRRAPRTLYELEDFLKMLMERNQRDDNYRPRFYDRVALETTSSIWNLIEDAVCREEKIKHFAAKDTWARAYPHSLMLLRKLFELIQAVRNRTGASFILTAHQRTEMKTSVDGSRFLSADIELPNSEKTRDHVFRMREMADNVWFMAQMVSTTRARGSGSTYAGSRRIMITRKPELVPGGTSQMLGFIPEAKSRGDRPAILDASWNVLTLSAGEFEQYRHTAEVLLAELSPGEILTRLKMEFDASVETRDVIMLDSVIQQARDASYVFHVSDDAGASGKGTVEQQPVADQSDGNQAT